MLSGALNADCVCGLAATVEGLIGEGCELGVSGAGRVGKDVRRARVGPELRGRRAGDRLIVEGADVGSGVDVRADRHGDDVEAARRRDAEVRRRVTFLHAAPREWLRGRSTRLDAEDGGTTKRLGQKKARRSGPSTLALAGQFHLPAQRDYSRGEPGEHHTVQHETGLAREVRNGLRRKRAALVRDDRARDVVVDRAVGWITNWILNENSQEPVLSATKQSPSSRTTSAPLSPALACVLLHTASTPATNTPTTNRIRVPHETPSLTPLPTQGKGMVQAILDCPVPEHK